MEILNYIFTNIPHKCIWKVTRYNGISHRANEKKCILCGKYVHLPYRNWLKDKEVWVNGDFDAYLKADKNDS